MAALGGCSILSGGPPSSAITLYAPDVRVAPDPAWPQVDWSLAIARPTAARMIDSPRILVRPTPDELQVYRGVSWAQPATDLVENAVLRALEDSGRMPAVARLDTGIRADYKLVMDIRRFEADYAGQAVPSAVIEINAKLLNSRDQHVVASQTFLQAAPSAGTEPAQVTAAFETSLTSLTNALTGWILTQQLDS
ncbi:ABC transporter [Pseudoxanthomonas kalamensis DSM 18571]|uniref:ABC-type transport auxiliary lipoprotein family protein n=1 Tax=Pseudoxanthomonas kalamensis TaxID=289483 RepID=UPI0013908D59|nr:ABC-type transport auxiliary lipoprotein family protein [Pseudoxanthomonas kalamensis]KAF1708975.1 ABC transporter [Pseudoxanthomonas kalamensis DSM 18571]